MKNPSLFAAGTIALLFTVIPAPVKKSPFLFTPEADGLELSEDGKPVYFYRKTPKQATGTMAFNNYLHPVYNLKGEVITEEFPADHLHHRGIFWAWHQLFLGDLNLGDQWMMDKISQEVIKSVANTDNRNASLKVNVLWKSTAWQNGTPFIEERTTITVYKKEADFRIIDFEIILIPLAKGVQIGGSDDEKGYGGFSVRIGLPENTVFISEKGKVIPQNLQILSGPWMDVSASHGSAANRSGVAILCHNTSPNYPEPWILRQTASMQNVVFPGRNRINLDKPVTLRYRLVIHNGDASTLDIQKMQADYNLLYGSR